MVGNKLEKCTTEIMQRQIQLSLSVEKLLRLSHLWKVLKPTSISHFCGLLFYVAFKLFKFSRKTNEKGSPLLQLQWQFVCTISTITSQIIQLLNVFAWWILYYRRNQIYNIIFSMLAIFSFKFIFQDFSILLYVQIWQ